MCVSHEIWVATSFDIIVWFEEWTYNFVILFMVHTYTRGQIITSIYLNTKHINNNNKCIIISLGTMPTARPTGLDPTHKFQNLTKKCTKCMAMYFGSGPAWVGTGMVRAVGMRCHFALQLLCTSALCAYLFNLWKSKHHKSILLAAMSSLFILINVYTATIILYEYFNLRQYEKNICCQYDFSK